MIDAILRTCATLGCGLTLFYDDVEYNAWVACLTEADGDARLGPKYEATGATFTEALAALNAKCS